MATWSVRIELAPPPGAERPTVGVLNDLTRLLAPFRAAVTEEDRNHLSVQLTVSAPTWRAASTEAGRAIDEATKVVVPGATVVDVQVVTWAEYKFRLIQPRVPELWGVKAAAEHLGVHSNRIHQFAQEHPNMLRQVPIDGVRANVWAASVWRHFDETARRGPGRPPSYS